MKLEENRAPDPKEESAAGDRQEIMEIAMRAGHILLENGAEISRVEETIDRICRHYGIQSANSFVLSNGIFSTMGNQREEFFARVQHIPVSGAHLNRVAAVNQLSREIEEGKHTIADLERCLDDIETCRESETLSRSWRRQWEAAHSACFSAGISWTARRHFYPGCFCMCISFTGDTGFPGWWSISWEEPW